ncbi:MAG: (2Fe-2S) ferredoxin domain-containing protein [Actinobacteria bacterium]|nr:(2Fe-2S) ferredoxin domain-containing protein [Actinomycetota bacterium]
MKSLAELEELRKKAQEDLRVREGKQATRIVVGTGTCGIAAGAREVTAAILDELRKRGLTGVSVVQTGCVGLCEKEPLVDVVVPGKGRVTYGRVTPDNARRIVGQHVVNENVVGELVVAVQ